MPSAITEEKLVKAGSALVALGMFGAGVKVIYDGVKSKKKRNAQRGVPSFEKTTPANTGSRRADSVTTDHIDATFMRHEQETTNDMPARATHQATPPTQDHQSRYEAANSTGHSKGVYYDPEAPCFRREDNGDEAIRDGFEFGDFNRTDDMYEATEELGRRYGFNRYM